MSKTKYFYERSNILNFESNITYGELVRKPKREFVKWIDLLRQEVLRQWHDDGIPPVIGLDERDIVDQMKSFRATDTKQYFIGDDNCNGIISNFSKRGACVNQFFPSMMKTRPALKGNISIYDWFTDTYRTKFMQFMFRILYNDSMYIWSKCLLKNPVNNPYYREDESVTDIFRAYKSGDGRFDGKGLRVSNLKLSKSRIETGYADTVNITADEIRLLYNEGIIEDWMLTYTGGIDKISDTYTIKDGNEVRYNFYSVRVFEENTRLFPNALQTFRIGLSQPAVNFPPLTAKFLYEHFTSHIPVSEKITVYDPSAGWGGRIIGAMSANRDVHYVGTDPNTENVISELGITRYEYVADYYLTHAGNTVDIDMLSEFFDVQSPYTYDVFRLGSEDIQYDERFQRYKGQFDFVFTSPPYFNREQYSDDETQSFKKFPHYADWRDKFLKPTLTTCAEYLKRDRYLCWNIADIRMSSELTLPLEQDSIDILTELGMQYRGVIKMLMTPMIGVDREFTIKNSVEYDGKVWKYEPIFVFYKP